MSYRRTDTPNETQVERTLTAARFLRPRETSLTKGQRPEPGPSEVLIEVARAGICGTDLHILHGDYELARFPLTPGHEFSGRIAAVGEGVSRLVPGQRVTADPNIPCLRCPECERQAFNQCHDLQVLGVTRDGAFADYLVVPERVVYPVGEMSYEDAAFIEPLACVAWGLERIAVEPGSNALVFGAGPMGCLLMQAVKAAGAARVAVVDVVPRRLEIARELGADLAVTPEGSEDLSRLAPYGFELVADATGVPSVVERSVGHARPGGTIWIFGVTPGDARVSISPYEFFRRDLSLVGSFAVNRTFPQAIAMLQSGAVRVGPLVSHLLPLAQFAEGMRIAEEDPGRMKVQFAVGELG